MTDWIRLNVERPLAEPVERDFEVALFRAPDCLRGWLAYSARTAQFRSPDRIVTVRAASMSQAKSRAITAANARERDDE